MKALLALEQALGKGLLRDYHQRTLRQATVWSCRAFVQQNLSWEHQLFDEHFLRHGAAALLEGYTEGRAPDAAALAEAWADQCYWKPQTRAELVTELTPVAAQFLALLEAELRRLWGAEQTHSPIGIGSRARG